MAGVATTNAQRYMFAKPLPLKFSGAGGRRMYTIAELCERYRIGRKDSIADKFNNRPRKRHGFRSLAQIFNGA
jgi:hypothetical protein